ncbi:MAG: DUF4272 domain-containing protein [Lachnospiraceae bacterium]|nr:DUF4272 domain-containing protein [Lachnospiraceae bacterium]
MGLLNRNKKEKPQQQEPSEQTFMMFSRETDMETIMSAFADSFEIQHPSGGNMLHLENQETILEIHVFLESMNEEWKQNIQNQKEGMRRFFALAENENLAVKQNLIHYIGQCHAFIIIELTSKRENAQKEDFRTVVPVLLESLKRMDGILVLDDGMAILDENGKLILHRDGRSEVERFFPFTYVESPEIFQNCTKGQIERRNKNMKALFDRDIYTCELPLNEDDEKVQLRSHQEVAERIVGTLAISLYSEVLLNPQDQMTVPEARDFVKDVLKDFQIDDATEVMTPEELKYFMDDNSQESTRINYSWHYENLFCLEWILGLMEWKEPTEICDVGACVRILREYTSIEELVQKTTMRSVKEILDMADLSYRMDWAAVDARIYGMKPPAGWEEGIIHERHMTLNWMIRFMDAEWDDVDTPT